MPTPAQLYVRSPDGSVGTIPAEQEQDALNAGYVAVSPEEAQAAQEHFRRGAGDQAAVSAGVAVAPEGYSQTLAAGEKALSAGTFGLLAPDSAAARARGKRFQEEHPYKAFAAEVAGQLPLAVATGGLGEAAVAGAAEGGLALRAAAKGLDWGAQALVGGAQTEAEETRLSGEDFSWTDAAVTGLAGEALGRGAAWGVSRALGGSRNLLAKGARRAVADDAASSLSRGGMLNDFRVAQHAETYQNELADLAARDLDALEENFAEVSRQDRKRARIVRTVTDQPEVQEPIRLQAREQLLGLRDALEGELDAGGGPARRLLKQLDDRVEALDAAPTGKKLWRLLDENRQALQEHALDVHQAYETNPGSAWLSRDGLAALDAAEKSTREALLREDAWGSAAAEAQAAYNVPFHEKYFPTVKTVRGKLMFSPQNDARGFAVFRGEPGAVRRFFAREPGDVDAARLAEQFRDYLDGVEAIARASEGDAQASSRNVLESVRRLRKATANAEYVAAAARRTGERAKFLEGGVEAAGGVVGAVAGGPGGGALGWAAVRGARVGDWLFRAGKRLGLGGGSAESMARLLEKDALPAAGGRDRTVAELLDDVLETPTKPSPGGPPSGAPPTGAGGAGLTPSMAADAQRNSWVPSEPPGPTAAGRTPTDELGPTPTEAPPGSVAPEARPTRFVGEREVHAGQVEAEYTDALHTARARAARDAARVDALSRGEFADVVERLRASNAPEAKELATALERGEADLVREGLVAPKPRDETDAYFRDRAAVRGDKPFEPGEIMPARATNSPVEEFNRQAWAPMQPTAGAEPVPPGVVQMAFELLQNARAAGRSASQLRRALSVSQEKAEEIFAALTARDDVVVRAGRAFVGVNSSETRAAADVLQQGLTEAGLQVRMGAERLPETMVHVFGAPDRAPTPEQWRRLAPLDELAKIAPVSAARIDVLGDAFIWSAEGERTLGADGFEAQAWTISRTFSRDEKGLLEVHHDHFFVQEGLQGGGAGAAVLRSMLEVYPKLGVDLVSVDAVEVGKYFWPSIGFNCSKENVSRAVERYARWLVNEQGLSEAAAAEAVRGVKSLPSLAQAEFGKDFLLSVSGNWNFGLQLKLSDENPLYHLMRGRLDIAAAGALALGGALEGNAETDDGRQPKPDDQQAAAEAGLSPGVVAFGATAALFRSARGRLVRQVAKHLFSSVAEPAAKTVARLAYSKAQLAQRQEEFHSWQANPQELVDRVAEGFRDAPPAAFSSAAAGVFAAASFLREKLPQNAKPSPVALRGAPVSAEAAAKYARYEQAALEPQDALREGAQAGYLSPELLETLQQLYPDLLAEFRVEAYQQVRAGGPPLGIQAKTQYARLFDGDGALADPAFGTTAVQMVSYAYEQAAQPQGPKTGAGPRPGVSQTAAAVSAPRWGESAV